MTKVELVARALAASRTGRTDEWSECCADALLVLAACEAGAMRLQDIAAFEHGMEAAAPESVASSQAMQAALAENYMGLPL